MEKEGYLVVAVVPWWGVVAVVRHGVEKMAWWMVRGLVRKTGQHVLLPSRPAPLKTRLTAALAERAHLCKDGVVPFHVVVIVGTVGVTPTFDVEAATELGVVSLWDVVPVGMEYFAVGFVGFDFPFGVDLWVFDPCPFVFFSSSPLVGALTTASVGGIVILPFSWKDAVG